MTTASGSRPHRAPADLRTDLWLRRLTRSADARARLVCLPHAGGSANFFFPFADSLPSTVEAYAVQYPGRQDRRTEPCLTTVEELADAVHPVLREGLPGLPLVLLGHSMGAIVAFEVAGRMERSGTGAPLGLIASGRRAPSIRTVETVHQKDDAGLVAEIRRLSGTDDVLLDDPEIREMFLPALRADYRAIETYPGPAGPPLNCPVSVFVGDADPRVSLDEADAWRPHTKGDFARHIFPGGHFYLRDHPREFTTTLTHELARLCGSTDT
ncbi:thioesterase II family protein [Streptomyces reniochalinae]|uniref:Thioesterase n=1 Tax=Streptomyces reniochalinae TaxID=2250578 RepID=A0A367E5E4_9ACTN|nr:alpha/beta fold hydrolase [Streptomyces reniochalinae]RCG13286.1 thioesterase [Streptomyces reniochalinae]